MSVLSLLRLRTAADFAEWYRIGGEYVESVADGMELDTGDLVDRGAGVEALRRNRPPATLDPSLRRSIAATLLADATYSEPFCEWMPLWYELALLPPIRYAAFRLRRIARPYCRGIRVEVPRFSRPRDVLVDGRPASAHVSSFSERFLLANAILHVEWFVHVARESGVRVPADLVARTRDESVAYYAGRRAALSPEVRRFQALLFGDDAWVREIDRLYGLNSRLFGVWERILRAERERLEAAAP